VPAQEKTLPEKVPKIFFWSCENGHAVRTEVQVGVSDGQWIEVTNRQVRPKSPGEESWAPIDGSEQVILGDLSVLSEGAPVRLADSATTKGGNAPVQP